MWPPWSSSFSRWSNSSAWRPSSGWCRGQRAGRHSDPGRARPSPPTSRLRLAGDPLDGQILPIPDLIEFEVAAREAAVLLEIYRGTGTVIIDPLSGSQRLGALGKGGDTIARPVCNPPDMALDLVHVRASRTFDRQQQNVDLVVGSATIGILDLAVGFLANEAKIGVIGVLADRRHRKAMQDTVGRLADHLLEGRPHCHRHGDDLTRVAGPVDFTEIGRAHV